MKQSSGNTESQVTTWLKEQVKEYRGLLAVMERQKSAAEKADEAGLLVLMQEKAFAIQRLQELESKIAGAMKDLPEGRRARLAEQSRSILQAIESALKRIILLEEHCENLLTERREEIRDEVHSFRQNKSLLKGYGASGMKRTGFSKNV